MSKLNLLHSIVRIILQNLSFLILLAQLNLSSELNIIIVHIDFFIALAIANIIMIVIMTINAACLLFLI